MNHKFAPEVIKEKKFWVKIKEQLEEKASKPISDWNSYDIKNLNDAMNFKLFSKSVSHKLKKDCDLIDKKKINIISTFNKLFKYQNSETVIREKSTKNRFSYYLEGIPADDYMNLFNLSYEEDFNLANIIHGFKRRADVINRLFDKITESNFIEKFNILHLEHINELELNGSSELAYEFLRNIYNLIIEYEIKSYHQNKEIDSILGGFRYEKHNNQFESLINYIIMNETDTNEIDNKLSQEKVSQNNISMFYYKYYS